MILNQMLDPLAIDTKWPSPVPLMGLEEALEQTIFLTGISREQLLERLLADVKQKALMPLLWLLPSKWKLAPALLPAKLQCLAAIIENGLLSPILLGALADDLSHLLAANTDISPTAVQLWFGDSAEYEAIPASLAAWLMPTVNDQLADRSQAEAVIPSKLSGGLIWHNVGLPLGQSAQQQQLNNKTSHILNRLAANLLANECERSIWNFDQAVTGRSWIESLLADGWLISAQLRTSVASFGLGASLQIKGQGWTQVPLALPFRTGLFDNNFTDELHSLLPHSCLELTIKRESDDILLQYYQGTEGFCGWESLNDQPRPWQNDRHNGTVRYLGDKFNGDDLLNIIDICEWISLVHNKVATDMKLQMGGYGSLGFCIDSSALLQQASTGKCDLYPVLLTHQWRYRLAACSSLLRRQLGARLSEQHDNASTAYNSALEQLPLDLSPRNGDESEQARRRLRTSLPISSPFLVLQQLHCLDK